MPRIVEKPKKIVRNANSKRWIRFLEQFYNLELIDELLAQLKKKHEIGLKPHQIVQLSVLHSYIGHILREYK